VVAAALQRYPWLLSPPTPVACSKMSNASVSNVAAAALPKLVWGRFYWVSVVAATFMLNLS